MGQWPQREVLDSNKESPMLAQLAVGERPQRGNRGSKWSPVVSSVRDYGEFRELRAARIAGQSTGELH